MAAQGIAGQYSAIPKERSLAHGTPFDLPVGCSHLNRAFRNDQHDAIGVELRVTVESEIVQPKKKFRYGNMYAFTSDESDTAMSSDSASQPVSAVPVPQKPRSALVYIVASALKTEINEFWEDRGEEGASLQRDIHVCICRAA